MVPTAASSVKVKSLTSDTAPTCILPYSASFVTLQPSLSVFQLSSPTNRSASRHETRRIRCGSCIQSCQNVNLVCTRIDSSGYRPPYHFYSVSLQDHQNVPNSLCPLATRLISKPWISWSHLTLTASVFKCFPLVQFRSLGLAFSSIAFPVSLKRLLASFLPFSNANLYSLHTTMRLYPFFPWDQHYWCTIASFRKPWNKANSLIAKIYDLFSSFRVPHPFSISTPLSET